MPQRAPVGSDYTVRTVSVVHIFGVGRYVHSVDAAWYEATPSLSQILIQNNNHNMR
jgi:hypothetical protein